MDHGRTPSKLIHNDVSRDFPTQEKELCRARDEG